MVEKNTCDRPSKFWGLRFFVFLCLRWIDSGVRNIKYQDVITIGYYLNLCRAWFCCCLCKNMLLYWVSCWNMWDWGERSNGLSQVHVIGRWIVVVFGFELKKQWKKRFSGDWLSLFYDRWGWFSIWNVSLWFWCCWIQLVRVGDSIWCLWGVVVL